VKFGYVVLEKCQLPCIQTDIHIHRYADCNTFHPSRGKAKITYVCEKANFTANTTKKWDFDAADFDVPSST